MTNAQRTYFCIKELDRNCIICDTNCNFGDRIDLRIAMYRKTETERGTTQVKHRMLNSIAKQGTAAQPGPPGTQHPQCASGPFVALSHVPVRFDGKKVGFTPPRTYFQLSILQNTAASAFVAVWLPSTPHAFFAWRAICVALGQSRCLNSDNRNTRAGTPARPQLSRRDILVPTVGGTSGLDTQRKRFKNRAPSKARKGEILS